VSRPRCAAPSLRSFLFARADPCRPVDRCWRTSARGGSADRRSGGTIQVDRIACAAPDRCVLFSTAPPSRAVASGPLDRVCARMSLLFRSRGGSEPLSACARPDEFDHSRGAFAPELWHGTTTFPPSEGRRSAGRRNPTIGRIGGCGSALLRKRARLSAPHRGAHRSFDPSAQPRAALPGITGCKREDPPRRQCSEHLADQS